MNERPLAPKEWRMLTKISSITHDTIRHINHVISSLVTKRRTYLEKHPELLERLSTFQRRIYNTEPSLANAILNKMHHIDNIDAKGSFHAVFFLSMREKDDYHGDREKVLKLPVRCTGGRAQEIFRPRIEQVISYLNILEGHNLVVPTTMYVGGIDIHGLPLYGILQDYIPDMKSAMVTRSSLLENHDAFVSFQNMVHAMDQLTTHETPMLLDLMGLEAAAQSISYLVHATRGTLPSDTSAQDGDFPWENLVYTKDHQVKLMDTIPFPVEFTKYSHTEQQHAKALMYGYKRYMMIVYDVLCKEYELRRRNELPLLQHYARRRVFPELIRYTKEYGEFWNIIIAGMDIAEAKLLQETMRWFEE